MSIARIAIITGAAGGQRRYLWVREIPIYRTFATGIGAAVAKRLARDGLNVAINDLPNKQDLLDSVAKEIRALGRKAITVTGDISSEEDVKNMIKQTVDQLGGLDVVCNIQTNVMTLDFLSYNLDGCKCRIWIPKAFDRKQVYSFLILDDF